MGRKIASLLLCLSFLFQQTGFAEVIPALDIAGHLGRMRSNLILDKFRPLQLRYFSYDNINDNFKLLFDKGDFKKTEGAEFQESTRKLLSYFLIGISLPDKSFWVNLRPDSEDRIIDDELAKTDVGKILLEADLQLKKDTAKFTSPETTEGRDYWDKLYKKAGELFGSENITIPTLTRPWIVPGEIIIRETADSAFVYKSALKVMLESDYLTSSTGQTKNITSQTDYSFQDPRLKALNEYSSQLIRELIIPKLTKEVNIARRYAELRQVYSSLILSRWFKARFKGLPRQGGAVPFYVGLIDSQNLNGLTSKESWSKTTYFKEYQKSFNNGEYNLKEPVYTPTGQVIRSYFSGGIVPVPEELPGLEGRNDLVPGGLVRAMGPLLEGQSQEGNPLPDLKSVVNTDEKKPVQSSSPIRPFVVMEWKDVDSRILFFDQFIQKNVLRVWRIAIPQDIMNRNSIGTRQHVRFLAALYGLEEVAPNARVTGYPIEFELRQGVKDALTAIIKKPAGTIPQQKEREEAITQLTSQGLNRSIASWYVNKLIGRGGASAPAAEEPRASSPMEEEAIPTDDMRKKLQQLEAYLPSAPTIVWDFGRFLSGRLNPELVPMGFLLAAGLALYDLQKGVDGFTSKPITDRNLLGLSKDQYESFWLSIPRIADAVTPKAFAKRVREEWVKLGGASSPMVEEDTKDLGGIDFRVMNIITKPLVDFSGLNFTLPKLSNIEGVNLSEELQQIQKLIQAGIIPSGSRVKEFVAMCYQKGELKQRMDDVIACLVEICRLEEETLSETSTELKETLVICDSNKFAEEI